MNRNLSASDYIYGSRAGNNLFGFYGDDFIQPALGNDFCDGGSGNDTLSLYDHTTAISSMTLSSTNLTITIGSEVDTLTDIEILICTQSDDQGLFPWNNSVIIFGILIRVNSRLGGK